MLDQSHLRDGAATRAQDVEERRVGAYEVRGCVEVALAPFGLTPTQFLVLVRLKSSEGLSGAELARATGVRPQSITELIGPLERDGLITRKEAPEHKRILRISLVNSRRSNDRT